MKTSTKLGLLILLLVVIVEFVLNPVRFHQTAHAGELTMQVPVFWTPMKSPGKLMPVSLHREWGMSGMVNVMDRTALDPTEGLWSMETARHAQSSMLATLSKNPRISNPRAFDLNAGKFPSVCTEATFNDTYQSLICYVVGTPLQFTYGGSKSSEPAAQAMLISLN